MKEHPCGTALKENEWDLRIMEVASFQMKNYNLFYFKLGSKIFVFCGWSGIARTIH